MHFLNSGKRVGLAGVLGLAGQRGWRPLLTATAIVSFSCQSVPTRRRRLVASRMDDEGNTNDGCVAGGNPHAPTAESTTVASSTTTTMPAKNSGKTRPCPSINLDKKKSEIWEHFTLLDDCELDKPKAACNYCGKDYGACGKQDGTKEDDPRFKLSFMENDDENENANENDGGRRKGKGKRFISYPIEEDWKVNGNKYKVLSLIVRDVLALLVPVDVCLIYLGVL
ncbi:hypothetical protein CsSME_00037245 [Camellia sinensis var. sinensis]